MSAQELWETTQIEVSGTCGSLQQVTMSLLGKGLTEAHVNSSVGHEGIKRQSPGWGAEGESKTNRRMNYSSKEYLHVCVHVCVYIYNCIYTYIHIYILFYT